MLAQGASIRSKEPNGDEPLHQTALDHGKAFFETYLNGADEITVVDVGALDVNGSLRSAAPSRFNYIGVDFDKGNGVDVVLTDPYFLPFDDSSVDAVVSSSCFEHSEFFWLSFLEAIRILKPSGLLYLNVPSNGYFHRYPVDCWRFYPDSGIALQNWARRNGYDTLLLESFIGCQKTGVWNDFVAIFLKDDDYVDCHKNRIQGSLKHYTNGFVTGVNEISNFSVEPEDQLTVCFKIRRLIQNYLRGGLK
jgi:SAM-dependent methyltransferase